MDQDLNFKLIKPGKSLTNFVESFWLLHNQANIAKEIVIVPDGREMKKVLRHYNQRIIKK